MKIIAPIIEDVEIHEDSAYETDDQKPKYKQEITGFKVSYACMFNRTYMMSRIRKAKEQGVAICNYGVALAKLTGILDKVEYV